MMCRMFHRNHCHNKVISVDVCVVVEDDACRHDGTKEPVLTFGFHTSLQRMSSNIDELD